MKDPNSLNFDLEDFFNLNLDLLCVADTDGNFIRTNHAWEDVLGYSSQELSGKKFLDFVHPEDAEKTLSAVATLQSGNEVKNFVNRYRSKDGSYRYIEWRSRPKGKIIYAAARDITDRILKEQELRDSEEKLRLITENMGEVFWLRSVDNTRMLYISPAYETIWGRSCESLYKDPGSFMESIDHRDLNSVLECYREYQKTGFFNLEYRIVRPDGGIRWIQARSFPVKNNSGLITANLGIAIDITEKRRQELQLEEERKKSEQFFNQSLHGFFFCMLDEPVEWNAKSDKDKLLEYILDHQKMVRVNQAMLDQYGANEADFIGLTVRELFAHDLDHAREIWRGLFDRGKWHVETQERKLDGTPMVIDGDYICLYDELGSITGHFGVQVDITDQKKLESDLRESDLRFSVAIDGTEAGIWDWDMIENRVVFSERWKSMLGYEDSEVENSFDGWKNLWHPDDARYIESSISDYREGKSSKYEIIYRCRHKNGTWRWIMTRGKLLRDPSGQPCRWIGTNIDISDLRMAQAELVATKEQFELAINGTNDGIWDWNLKTNELFLSKRWKDILGYSDEELKNEFQTFASLVHEEDFHYVNEYVESYLKGLIESYAIEFRMRAKDGSIKWILAKGEALRDENGIPYRMAGSHSDITLRKEYERKLSENQERLELALEAGEHGFWDWNLEDNTTYFSPVYYTMLGYDVNELPMNFDTFDYLIHKDDKLRVMPLIEESIKKGTTYEQEFRLLCKDGNYRWIVGKGKSYFKDRSGKPYRAVGIHQDIHHRKLLEAELISAKEQAETASKAKSQFLANMSHEIRTPLNGVIGFTELLKNTNLSALQRQYVENANVSGHTLLGIINDILDFSKIEAGMMELEFVKTDMMELFSGCIGIVQYSAEKKNLNLLSRMDPHLPRYAFVDPVRLKQVLTNLLGNAVKFTEQGQVELRVDFQPVNSDSGRFTVSIRDTGIGISEKQKSKLFKAFSQADDSTTRKFGGTGLGLIISQMIVEKMGSHIRFSSEEGQGSIFSFEFVAKISGDVVGEHTMLSVRDSLGEKIPQGLKVLIAEDVGMNMFLIKSLLVEMIPGIEVIEATNGQEAVDAHRRILPDLILMDVQMPILDGLEATEAIRIWEKNTGKHTPIIALTAGALKEEMEACYSRGMDGFITKPIDTGKLKKVFADHVLQGGEPPPPPREIRFNKKHLVDQYGEAVARQAVAMAQSEFPKQIGAISEALRDQEPIRARQSIHKLKGSALGTCMPGLYELAKEMEALVLAEDFRDWGILDEKFRNLQEEWGKILDELVI